jgi:hypothetical protein
METAAREMDICLWNILEQAAGIDIPRIDDGRGLECCPAPPVRRLERKSYPEQENLMDQLEQFLPYIGCSVLTLWDSRWW